MSRLQDCDIQKMFYHIAYILMNLCNRHAGFRLTCRLPHCRFDDDICTTAQAPLAVEG